MFLRKANTKRSGADFSQMDIINVWMKGAVVPGFNPAQWRKDSCGAFISFAEYGNTNSSHGWEIDHILVVDNGGTDDLWNLQPLQWQNNREKSNKVYWSCAVVAAAR